MEIEKLLIEFEQKLLLQHYSPASIKNYKSAVKSFLEIAQKKFSNPTVPDELIIEKYVLWTFVSFNSCWGMSQLKLPKNTPILPISHSLK